MAKGDSSKVEENGRDTNNTDKDTNNYSGQPININRVSNFSNSNNNSNNNSNQEDNKSHNDKVLEELLNKTNTEKEDNSNKNKDDSNDDKSKNTENNKEDKTNTDTTDLNNLDFETIDNPTVRNIAKYIKSISPDLDFNKAFNVAIQEQDDRLIDKVYLKEVAGDKYDFILESAKTVIELSKQDAENSINEIYKLADGQNNWLSYANLFNKEAPKGTKNIITKLLNSTSKKDVFEAANFIIDFGKQKGVSYKKAERVKTVSSGRGSVNGISKTEFIMALKKLNNKDYDYQDKKEELIKLRKLGVESGIN